MAFTRALINTKEFGLEQLLGKLQDKEEENVTALQNLAEAEMQVQVGAQQGLSKLTWYLRFPACCMERS